MNKLWIRNGKFVSDEYGRPLVCPICPCSTCEEKIAWLQHLATAYGGTFYGEGYIRTPDIEGLVAPAVEVFQAAMIYAVTVNEITTQYIITVGCGDDCPLGKRILRDRESYIEKNGVCDCPALASFVENAEFEGHTVYGESALVHRTATSTINHQFNWQCYSKVAACYKNEDTGVWHYIACNCTTGTASADYLRFDSPCDGCFDIRTIIIENASSFGLIDYQYGSHTCYEYMGPNGSIRLPIDESWNASRSDLRILSGYVDFRELVTLHDIGGQRFIHRFAFSTYDHITPVGYRKNVASDAVLSGYAKLMEFWGLSTGRPGWEDTGWDTNDVAFFGDSVITMMDNQYTESFFVDTEAEAIAISKQLAPIDEHHADMWALLRTTGNTIDTIYISELGASHNYPFSCDNVSFVDGKIREWGNGSYSASRGGYVGITSFFRVLRTNKGLMLKDGSFVSSIYVPGFSDFGDCYGVHLGAAYGRIYELSGVDYMTGGVWDYSANIHENDPICPNQIDPEEFE